jgi:hypothetical protein
VIASVVLRSGNILDHLLKLFLGEQIIAQVVSVNHFPQVHTILVLG